MVRCTCPTDRPVRAIDGPPSVSVETQAGEMEVRPLDVRSGPVRPNGYVNYILTGASAVWPETAFGDGSVVAVVDTGTYPVAPCLSSGQVIGAPGFPDGFDAVGDNPANAPDNYAHGTWVGGVIASACSLTARDTNALAKAIATYAPGLLYPVAAGYVGFDLLGIAPLAKLYPVKVFTKSGGGTPTSTVLAGLDHVLELKKSGLLDIDVVNLSLGGPTLFDGRDAFDRFIDEMRKAGMVVVASASNDGTVPNTVGSPATSFSAIATAATDEPVPSRIFYEYLGLARGADGIAGNGDEEAGHGLLMRPTAETRDRQLLEPRTRERRASEARDRRARYLELRGEPDGWAQLGDGHVVLGPDDRGRRRPAERLLGGDARSRDQSGRDPQRPAPRRRLPPRGP